ncbi:MAG: maltose operon protein MalM [Enterobacter sp.]|uniref:maltose operon protein MalM n=1 Tax=Enterobacter sp. TaxID=42895 RepID=UPI002909A473|nr:maltose operon protein MalM [Enterobacter sp.]MDU6058888.1 maltose operon protein MalM [Enterobacter sp.]
MATAVLTLSEVITMKMKKSLVALCLSAGLAIPAAALQQLTWTPVDQSKTQSTQLSTGGQQLNVPGITGPVAAYSVPANIGELTLTLTSEVDKQTSVFAPNVLILDQNLTPSAFFPSSYFSYQEPGVMSADRLQGVMRLTPALGQQKIYVLVFTTEKDLQQTTTLVDPAKAYAKGTGNSVPDIPDPLARHTTDGLVKLKVSTNSASSVLVGPLFGSSGPGPVTVGNTAAPAYAAPVAAAPAAAPAPAKKSEPVLNDTEEYFNNAIKQAVKRGDVDKALKLLDEAERLGSTTARSTFISSVKGKG